MTGLQPEDFDALDDILDELRTRYEETPQWEFCEGFMVALICCRRAMPEAEWLPVLLGLEDDEGGAGFSDEAQRVKFLSLWQQRFDEVKQSLDTEIKALDEDSAYAPEVMDAPLPACHLKSVQKLQTKKFQPLRRSGPWALCSLLRTGPMNGPHRKTKNLRSGTTLH
jgi:hypothetical protein